ncbi:LuxR C-terminal-related transcriptional regulator [Streptomyces sp. NPDC006385]|uniref:LuxR C-terminal-related transcriptional regulator n=1 Tax=Streptomyces sp. NPDC006385 TaxID=3156761 RepID=UPI0033AE9E77
MAQELKRFSFESAGELPPTMMLAHELDWDDVHLALDCGAMSYLLENRYAMLLGEALLCTSRGASILDPAIAADQIRAACRARLEGRVAAGTEPPARPERCQRLSTRERQVMELLAIGRGVRDVARELFLTDKTVRNYLSRIFVKLGVRSQREAILCWHGHLDDAGPGAARAR